MNIRSAVERLRRQALAGGECHACRPLVLRTAEGIAGEPAPVFPAPPASGLVLSKEGTDDGS